MTLSELKEFLDFKVDKYNHPDFIQTDPIQLPHQFSKKEDIEIIAFIVSTIAWGNRRSIISNGEKLIHLVGNQPYEFVMNYSPQNDLKFVHRTFNSLDLDYFFRALKAIYSESSFESLFEKHKDHEGVKGRIINFREKFLAYEHLPRTEKHIANPLKKSSAKRINMFLRWMVRQDQKGVDFGIWNSVPMSELHLPLDVHTGNISRKLGILQRTQNDWQAVEEIQKTLVLMDQNDPAKYDFALFGLGAFEEF